MISIRYHRGLELPAHGLWLDPHLPQPLAFVSHAHSDHIAAHAEIIASTGTARLMRARLGGVRREHLLEFGERREFGNFAMTLVPAGHIFGSAQCFLESAAGTLLYTGDFKLRPGLSAEPTGWRHAETLIMETTYGLPQYRMPPTDEVVAQMVAFCHDALDDAAVPVLLGYSLGKAQEILCALLAAGLKPMLHGAVFRMTEIYRQLRPGFPTGYLPYDAAETAGKVLVCPPSANRTRMLTRLKNRRTAVLTGWALTPGATFRYQCDAAFPLTDHADYPDLLRYVELVQPKRVLTLHGFAAAFAADLRERGIEAWALSEENQLELPLRAAAVETRMTPTNQPQMTQIARMGKEESGAGEAHAALSANLSRVEGAPRTTPADPTAKLHPPSPSPSLAPSPPPSALSASSAVNSSPPSSSVPSAPSSFATFAALGERLAATTSKLKKIAELSAYLRTLDDPALALAAVYLTGQPFAQADARTLQTGSAVIRRAVRAVSGLGEQAFRDLARRHADAGKTAHEALLGRTTPQPFSLADSAEFFTAIQRARGPLAKTALLQSQLARVTALEASYLVRILTGDLRIGLKAGLVEEALAAAFAVGADEIRGAQMLTGDLGETARRAKSGTLAETMLRLFHPIQPMLASPEPSAEAIWNRLGTSTAWAEDKYDGIRAQLHIAGGRVEIFTRDLRRATGQFADLVRAAGAFTQSAIFDGEILAHDATRRLTFFDLQKRLGRKTEDDLFLGASDIPVIFRAFDLLALDGTPLLQRPLAERRALLEKLALPAALELAPIHAFASAAEIDAAFTAARARGHEGLMVKDPASLYTPGRRGLAWLKLKKEFATLEVVVTAAEQGHGRRSHVLSDYTFAVRDDATGALLTIGKAYSGLTDEEIEELTEHFENSTLERRGSRREVRPEIVLEIAFDSVQRSDRHASGLALRFPRIKAIRRDKTPAEIDTLSHARSLVAKGAEGGGNVGGPF